MTSWFSRVLAVSRLEVHQVLSHPIEWLTAVVAPLFWCLVLAIAFHAGTLSGLSVGLVDLDRSATSRAAAQAIDALPSIQIETFENGIEADQALRRSETFATIVIPQNFELDQRRHAPAPITVEINKSWYAIGTLLEVDLKTALSTLSLEKAVIQAEQRGGTFSENAQRLRLTMPDIYFLGNTAFNFVAYLLPTILPGVLALGALLAFITMLTREWRAGGVRRLLEVAGGSGTAVVIGKLLPWLAVFLVCGSVWVAGFAGSQGWGTSGHFFFWFTATWLLILSMAALAALSVAVSLTWVLALSGGICLIAPTFPFTGFSFPLDSMTPGAQFFGQLLPLTHYLQAQAQVWVLGSPIDAILKTQGILALFPVVMFAAALPLLSVRLQHWKRQEEMSADLTTAELEAPGAPIAIVRTGFWRTFALTIKNAILSRDTIAIFGGAVAFYLIFYGWPYAPQQVEHVQTAIVDLDHSSASRRLIQAMEGTPALHVTSIDQDGTSTMEAFRRGDIAVVVTIPQDYEKSMGRGENSTIHILGSGAFPVKARAVQAAISTLVMDPAMRVDQASLLTPGLPPMMLSAAAAERDEQTGINVVYRFNEISGYGNYTVPAVGPIILQAVLLMGLGMSLGGWLSQPHFSPFVRDAVARPWCEGIAIAFAFWTIAFGWFLYMQGFAFSFGEYGAMSTPSAVLLLGACYGAAIVVFGMAAVTLIRPNAWTAPFFVVMSAPALFISGAVWPTADLHPLTVELAQLIPSTPAIHASVAAAQDGAQLADILPDCLHLLILTAVYGLFALWRLHRLQAMARPYAINDVA